MGCDIHAHAEMKINGKWEHIKPVEIPRYYETFATMVDDHVRSEGIKGIAPMRGYPDDCSVVTNLFLRDNPYADDLHTESWLSGHELMKIRPELRAWLKYYEYPAFKSDADFLTDNFRLVFAFDN